MRVFFTIFCMFSFLLAGCEQLPSSWSAPAADPISTTTVRPAASNSSPAETDQPPPTPEGPIHLVIWVPPFMGPEADSLSAGLFSKRLAEFADLHPGLEIETRTKTVHGPGGLLDFLSAANAAAPTALPDLVALPRDIEETAAVKGLLLSLDELSTAIDDPDWFPYAIELAHLQKNVYGFPFAGDALVQVYHSNLVNEPLTSWSGWKNANQGLLFPAGSEEALMTLALYQANGGLPLDDQGRPQISPQALSGVLDFYQQLHSNGSMDAKMLVGLQDDPSAWEAFTAAKGQSVVIWASHYLQQAPETAAMAPIPTPEGKASTLATGWVWSIAARDEQKRHLAVNLAEFLTESQFLADWTESAGYLPTRPSSLKLWSDQDLASSAAEILGSAVLTPPTDVLSVLQLPLQQATIAVLQNQLDPLEAAQQASASIIVP